MSTIESQIASKREQATALYKEIDLVRNRAKDTSLSEIAVKVPKLPKNSCSLKNYNSLRGHQAKITSAKWNYDSTKILSASQDGYMIIWDSVSGFKKQAIALDNQYVLSCCFSPNGRYVASGGLDNACTIYKIKGDENHQRQQSLLAIDLQVQSVFKGHTAYISECSFLDDNTILTASGDMTLKSWDVPKAAKIREFTDHMGDVLSMDVISSSNYFISGGSDGFAKIWDPRSSTPVQSHHISNSDVATVKSFPDGNSYLTGSDDGLVRLFDTRSDGEISRYSLVSQLNLHNDSHYEAEKAYSHKSSLLSKTASNISQFESPGVVSVDFSKSGRLFYASYADYGCIIWDTLKNQIIGSIGEGHQGLIHKVGVSPDGDAVFTSSWDSTIKVWSV